MAAFVNCSSLRSVDIPDTVRTIGPGAFSQCMNLEIVRISEGCTSIGLGAFDNDPKLKLVTIPSTILEIGVTAFRSDYNCTAILKSEHLSSEILSAARLADLKAVICPLSLSPLVSSVIGAEKILSFSDEEGVFLATIVSAQFRDNDSTILDVVYVVNSESPMVDIRFLAFEKGAIGFASVVRPE